MIDFSIFLVSTSPIIDLFLTKGLPKEEADNAILLFWKMWRKEKAKKKKHAKRLEEKNAKREAQGLPPIDKMKDVDPEQLKDNPSKN